MELEKPLVGLPSNLKKIILYPATSVQIIFIRKFGFLFVNWCNLLIKPFLRWTGKTKEIEIS